MGSPSRTFKRRYSKKKKFEGNQYSKSTAKDVTSTPSKAPQTTEEEDFTTPIHASSSYKKLKRSEEYSETLEYESVPDFNFFMSSGIFVNTMEKLVKCPECKCSIKISCDLQTRKDCAICLFWNVYIVNGLIIWTHLSNQIQEKHGKADPIMK